MAGKAIPHTAAEAGPRGRDITGAGHGPAPPMEQGPRTMPPFRRMSEKRGNAGAYCRHSTHMLPIRTWLSWGRRRVPATAAGRALPLWRPHGQRSGQGVLWIGFVVGVRGIGRQRSTDQLEEFTVGAPMPAGGARPIGRLRLGILAGLAHQGAQLLDVGIGKTGEPFAQGRIVLVCVDQPGAPLLCFVQGSLVGCASVALELQRSPNGGHRILIELAHELADELELASPPLEVGDAPQGVERFEQAVRQLQGREQARTQGQQILAQRLQGFALAFEVGLAGVGIALALALEFEIEFAAFGDEMAAHEVAAFGFA